MRASPLTAYIMYDLPYLLQILPKMAPFQDMSYDSNSTVLLSLHLMMGDCEGGTCGTRFTMLLAAFVVFGVVGVPLVVAFQLQRFVCALGLVFLQFFQNFS